VHKLYGGDIMSKIGLVMGGGGAKGAYQVGAWKAICESGLDEYIESYSGSSIGALNCALIRLKTWEEASEIWMNWDLSNFFLTGGADLNDISNAIIDIRNDREIQFDGLFSRDGLIELLNIIEIEKLENSQVNFFTTVSNITAFPEDRRIMDTVLDWYNGKNAGFVQYINLKNKSKKFIVDILLATSAIPIVYQPVEIGGQFYVDGGINDNLPVAPVFRMGYKKIIAISCSQINYSSLKRRFPSSSILLIQPSKYLGNLIEGTLNFKKSKLKDSYNLGYADAMKAVKNSRVSVERLLTY